MTTTPQFVLPPAPVLPPVALPAGFRPWPCRVGVDLTSVAEVADAVARLGDRYLERIYTPHELSCCTGTPQVVAAGLAARFAAKEAALKVLRPVGARPSWRSIEVRRVDGGACGLRLSGSAMRLAAEAGINDMTLSMTHETYWAIAVVVALCAEPPVGATGTTYSNRSKKENEEK